MNDLSEEINLAKPVIVSTLLDHTWIPSLPELCDDLAGGQHREDAVRMAAWSLVQDGKLEVTKDYKFKLI